jgi:hypothetical protein
MNFLHTVKKINYNLNEVNQTYAVDKERSIRRISCRRRKSPITRYNDFLWISLQ